MKKIFLIAVAGMACIFYSCNNQPAIGTDDNNGKAQEQKNLAAAGIIDKAFQTGDPGALDSVVAADFVDHTDKGDVKGIDSLKAMVTFIHTNFKDMQMDKVNEAADADYVYSWFNYSGNSDGTMGMAKGPYKMGMIELTKFKDGKASEHWSFVDMRDMMKMMPPPPPMNSKDSTKMKK